jgi:phage-related tail protein
MEDKVFELMEKMYSEFTEFRKETNSKFDNMDKKFDKLGNQVTRLEHDLKKDISALYDGYKQNTEQLNRIETEVTKHEELIIRKIK